MSLAFTSFPWHPRPGFAVQVHHPLRHTLERCLPAVSGLALMAGLGAGLAMSAQGQSEIRLFNSAPARVAVQAATGTSLLVEVATNLPGWTPHAALHLTGGSTAQEVDLPTDGVAQVFARARQFGTVGGTVATVRSLADLRFAETATERLVYVLGYYQPGDGGEGAFRWDSGSTLPEDGGLVVASEATPAAGRWLRATADSVSVKWFGARGDGATEDSAPLQAAIDAVVAAGGGRVTVPAGIYAITNKLLLDSNLTLEGVGGSAVIRCWTAKPYGALGTKDYFQHGGNTTNLHVRNLTVDLGGVGRYGVIYGAVQDGSIERVNVLRPAIYGIYLVREYPDRLGESGRPQRIRVAGCRVLGVTDVGIEFRGALACVGQGNSATGSEGCAFYVWDGAVACTLSGNTVQGDSETNALKAFSVVGKDATIVVTNLEFQTHNITLVGNTAHRVAIGLQVKGQPDNQPYNVTMDGNTLDGDGVFEAKGLEIIECHHVAVVNNNFNEFNIPITMNQAPGFRATGAQFIWIDRNTFVGGGSSSIYGNRGGSLSDNRFVQQWATPVYLFGNQDCRINGNQFQNVCASPGVAIYALPYQGLETLRNIFTGNHAFDDRPEKVLRGLVVFGAGAADYNMVRDNVALAAGPWAPAFRDLGTGTHNVVADNLDGQ